MAVDGAVSHHAVIVIQVVQQLLAREHFPRFVGKGLQQAELSRREIQKLAAPACLEAALVDNQRAFGVQHLQFALRFTAAKNGFHAGDDFTRAVGFADVIVRANFEAQQAVDFFDFCRHHDNRHVGEATNFPAQGQAVGAGEHQIQQDQIRRRLAHVRQHLIAMADKRRGVAGCS